MPGFRTTCLLSLVLSVFLSHSCRETSDSTRTEGVAVPTPIRFANGFKMDRFEKDITRIQVLSPWPEANSAFTYWLVPYAEDVPDSLALKGDVIIRVPVRKYVATSTTHIAALEALDELDKLQGFPGTDYISSKRARIKIDSGSIQELGANEALNTEMTLLLEPDVVFGFAIGDKNTGYQTLAQAGIPVVYNGDWTEHSPLGKAEWIRFFAPFFGKEKKADSIFLTIEKEYINATKLAAKAQKQPTVMSGALYKDVWYTPGGKSWAAQFIRDANARYLWEESEATGSLSLSLEHVLERATEADIWIAPSQFVSKQEMLNASWHYGQFKAFRTGRVYTYAARRGPTGGLIYFEQAPQRPDLVLKDLIHIFHPGVLPDHTPRFFTPLE